MMVLHPLGVSRHQGPLIVVPATPQVVDQSPTPLGGHKCYCYAERRQMCALQHASDCMQKSQKKKINI